MQECQRTLPLADARFEDGRRVLAPKVSGAWILHQLTRRLPLDWFIAFSSISAVWGSRGQPFYGAANHFLDALTISRRRNGLPMVTVNWGPWAEGGMVDRDGLVRLERMGLRALPPSTALDRLARLLGSRSGLRVVADVNWPLFKELFESRGTRPLLSRVGVAGTLTGPRTDSRAETALTRELRPRLEHETRPRRRVRAAAGRGGARLDQPAPTGSAQRVLRSRDGFADGARPQEPSPGRIRRPPSRHGGLQLLHRRRARRLSHPSDSSRHQRAINRPDRHAEVDCSRRYAERRRSWCRLFDEQIEAIDRGAVPRSDNG